VAYPQQILNWHQIVDDSIQGRSIAVILCPLCGSAVVFDREVNGNMVEFGVSGKLYNSNLIMHDRLEESYWQQETGEAIVGAAAKRGETLKHCHGVTGRKPILTLKFYPEILFLLVITHNIRMVGMKKMMRYSLDCKILTCDCH